MSIRINLTQIEYKLSLEAEYFNEYIIFNERELKKRQLSFEKYFQEDLTDFPRKDIMEHLYKDDLFKFPSYFYHSALILVFTIIETTLKDICDEITHKLQLPISSDELFGNNNISKSVNFIKKFTGIDLTSMDKDWLEINRFQKVRNAIIHQNASLPDSKNETELIKLININTSITIDAYKNFFITDSAPLLSTLKHGADFIYFIIEKIDELEFSLYNFKKASPKTNYQPLSDSNDVEECPF